jgi:hypothetical protein
MKKVMLIVGLVFLGMTSSYAQAEVEQAVNPNAPEITFEQEVMNYGTLSQGADGNRTFVFKNTGKEPLILTNVKASCGCTTPKWTRNPVAPGEKGEIVVHYDTNRMGQFHKTVTVQSNGKTSTKTLTIKGKIDPKEVEATSPVKAESPSTVIKK